MARTFLLILLFTSLIYSQNQGNYFPEYNLWQQDGLLLQSTNELYSWSYVQSPINNSILDIFFIDSSSGWAVHGGNGAMRTTDGGFNWITISFADTTFSTLYNGVHFINQQTGWCVGGAVQIRKTTNNGVNWYKQNAPPVAGVLNNIYFWNQNTGIAIGRKNIAFNSFICRTTNAGNNWTEIIATTNNNNELNDQYWFNENTGWINGRDVLLYTTNGGLNFINLYSNIPPTSNGANALLSIAFVNQNTGWIGASNLDKQNIYITTNAGSNWTFQQNPVAQYSYVQINDVKFLSADSGWAVHGTPFSGAIMFTTNRGTNWIIEDNTNTWFDCINYYQRYKAWCGASSGRVYYTYLQEPVGIDKRNIINNEFVLEQNYPNPFNPTTIIKYKISKQSNASIILYNAGGKLLHVLINKYHNTGNYEIQLDRERLFSGLYFYSLLINGKIIDTKKLIML